MIRSPVFVAAVLREEAKRTAVKMRGILWILVLVLASAAKAAVIPYPEALDSASVTETNFTDIGMNGFPMGNGDLGAVLWDCEGTLSLRVSKVDLWDARIDTSEDPALLKMDIKEKKWSGGTNKVPSWSKHDYPQPRSAALVRIGKPGSRDPVTSARLDIRRAVATANATTVRVLSDRNVILIDSPYPVSLEEISSKNLPPARLGEGGGVAWLEMTMPGDGDYKGMEYAIAVAAKGERKAVAVVTSFDTKDPVKDAAIRLATRTLDSDPVPRHEEEWEKFWAASGVSLADRFFQDAWYRNLYFMHSYSRAGTMMPITLFAALTGDGTPWHGAPTLNYNIEQTFWPMFVCNHVEAMEPYVRFLCNYAPRGRWLARETYGLGGLFLPLNIFGPEFLVPPEAAKSRNSRQICYVPWTYTLGCTGWGLQNLWLRYKYQPDRDYLESVYPLLRDGAEFYANVMEQCADGELGPSYNPEQGPFGTLNNPVDIAYFRFLFSAASEAAAILGRDANLAKRWDFQKSRVPDYETASSDSGPVIADWKGAAADAVKVHNITSPAVPVFPADQVTWFSPAAQREIFTRTIRRITYRDDNAHIMSNVARARFSMPEAYTMSRDHFSRILAPNGLFAKWPGHGFFVSESWAFAGLTGELLLQSVGNVIRIFPAWPRDQDASFTDLRAQGGFLVSAEQKGGKVVSLSIVSTAGGKLSLVSPWDGSRIETDTKQGDRLVFTEGRPFTVFR